jgi:hypothetical protein
VLLEPLVSRYELCREIIINISMYRLCGTLMWPILRFQSLIRLQRSINVFPVDRQPQWATASSLSWLHDHNQTHLTRQDSSVRAIGPSHRPEPDNTQHSHETDIYAPRGNRTRNLSKRAALDSTASVIGETHKHHHNSHLR